jgi:hypothetical protein
MRFVRSFSAASNDQSKSRRSRSERHIGRWLGQRWWRVRFQRSRYKLANRPNVIRDAKRHRWRTAQRFVDTTQIVEAGQSEIAAKWFLSFI